MWKLHLPTRRALLKLCSCLHRSLLLHVVFSLDSCIFYQVSVCSTPWVQAWEYNIWNKSSGFLLCLWLAKPFICDCGEKGELVKLTQEKPFFTWFLTEGGCSSTELSEPAGNVFISPMLCLYVSICEWHAVIYYINTICKSHNYWELVLYIFVHINTITWLYRGGEFVFLRAEFCCWRN